MALFKANMLVTLGIIALSAIIGALLRFTLLESFKSIYPNSTIVVNALGCFICGLVIGFALQKDISPLLKTGVIVGFCGSLTSFSAIITDIFTLISKQEHTQAIYYFLLTNVCGVLFMGMGIVLSQVIIKWNA